MNDRTTYQQLERLNRNHLTRKCLLHYINALERRIETQTNLLDRTIGQNARIVRDDEYLHATRQPSRHTS